jgi:hypothetical protein
MLIAKSSGRSVKLLMAVNSTVILGGQSRGVHDEDFCSLLDMYVIRSGASSLTRGMV